MEKDMMGMMAEMNSKMDAMMEHMGCKKMPEKEYMAMDEEDKDDYDENEVKSKMGKMKGM